MSSEATVNLREAARLSGVPLPTLRRWVQRGQVKALKCPGLFGMQWEIPESELPRLGNGPEGSPAVRSGPLINVINEPDRIRQATGGDQASLDLDASYWRGRWAELREVLDRLEKGAGPAPADEDRETEDLQEALRHKSRELAQARNLVDNLRREKARLEGEVQALRSRLRGGETTQVDMPPASGLRNASGGAWRG